jgi:hypothetical protein
MDQWQQEMQNALQNRDIETAKNLLFSNYFQTSDPSGAASSLVKGNLSSTHISQIIDNLDSDTQAWVQQQVNAL